MLKKAHKLHLLLVILGALLALLSLLFIGPTKDLAAFKDIRTRQIPFNLENYCKDLDLSECKVAPVLPLPKNVYTASSFVLGKSGNGIEKILVYYPLDILLIGLLFIMSGLFLGHRKQSNLSKKITKTNMKVK